jgi:hypothetical protein
LPPCLTSAVPDVAIAWRSIECSDYGAGGVLLTVRPDLSDRPCENKGKVMNLKVVSCSLMPAVAGPGLQAVHIELPPPRTAKPIRL